MALTKTVTTDKIETVDTGLGWHVVQVREAHVISEDGVEVSRTNRRYSINPTDTWTSYPADVQAICTAMHTTDRQSAYTTYMSNTGPEDDAS